jgi:hypothetical protein
MAITVYQVMNDQGGVVGPWALSDHPLCPRNRTMHQRQRLRQCTPYTGCIASHHREIHACQAVSLSPLFARNFIFVVLTVEARFNPQSLRLRIRGIPGVQLRSP